jgi:chemotaxis protein MotA
MNVEALADPWSAALVVAGTALATLLRCGVADLRATLHCLVRLARPRFTSARARAALARQVEEIRNDGVFRARPALLADPEIAEATSALIRHRSLAPLIETHERHRERRQAMRARALHLLGQAGELAPVFGLAGTLVALSQMPAAGLPRDGLMVAVGTAVLTTLYGLLAAHLTIFPLASLIERHGAAEEAERQLLVEWLAAQLAQAVPPARRGGTTPSAAAPSDLAA